MSPYLIQHPGLPGAAPAGVNPQDPAAQQGQPAEPPEPSPLAGYSQKVLKVIADRNLKAMTKRASTGPWSLPAPRLPGIGVRLPDPPPTTGWHPSNAMEAFMGKPWRRPEQGLFPGYDAAAPFGLSGVQPSDTAYQNMIGAFGINKEKNPWLYGGASIALKMGLGPLLQSKVDYTKHLGNPSHKFLQRMNTHRMFLEAGNNKLSPLATVGAKLLGSVLGDSAPDAETLSKGISTAQGVFKQ